MKPLLASPVELDKLQFPCFASPKYDGFRCLLHEFKGPVTRSLKPIANNYVRGKLAETGLSHLDGELLTYTGNKLDDFNVIQSKLASRKGLPDFKLMVFDSFKDPTAPYNFRLDWASLEVAKTSAQIYMAPQQLINNLGELQDYETQCLAENWEGVMVRSPAGIYKYGRSTTNEGILLKLKRFVDDEAEVIGATELMHNANEATTNELGYTERSSHKENLVGREMLGSLVMRWHNKGGVVFEIGTGFTEDQRLKYWALHRAGKLIGKTAQFKYQGIGSQGRPRFPVFRGFRYDL